MVSVYYEDIQLGQSASMEKTVTEHDVQMFGDATGDHNPVHFDEAYAAKTIFRGRVAHGALSIGFISAVVGMKLPGAGTIFVSARIDFKAPVRIGRDPAPGSGASRASGWRRGRPSPRRRGRDAAETR